MPPSDCTRRLIRHMWLLRTAALPFFAQAVAAGQSLFDPADLLVGEPADRAPKVLLKVAELVRHVARQNGVGGGAELAQRVAERSARPRWRLVCAIHNFHSSPRHTAKPLPTFRPST